MIAQVDSKTIYDEVHGGRLSKITLILNAFAACLFLIGIVFIAVFVWSNLEINNVK
jgi:hypothetical protein